MIYWTEFSWEAFAAIVSGLLALAAGLFAVRAASQIGLRQLKIQETTIRIELLDRRLKCISDMREVQSEWWRDAKLSPERWTQFRDMFYTAELLFSKPLSAEIEQVLDSTFWARHHMKRSRYYNDYGETEKARGKLDEAFAEEDKVFDLMPNLLKKMKNETNVADWL